VDRCVTRPRKGSTGPLEWFAIWGRGVGWTRSHLERIQHATSSPEPRCG
jgi:hypothetical protein